jgi:hypothetical protein
MSRGLGRRHAPDSRDGLFPLKPLLATVPKGELERPWRYWNAEGWWGDQGWAPQCVAYAWTHWVEDGPVTHPETKPGENPAIDPEALYHEAQKVDEWPGEDYDGTSVRAGAKVLKARGYVGEYRWANPTAPLSDVVKTLLGLGPVVVGLNWYAGMSEPDDLGFMHVSGALEGGHAFVLNGVNVTREVVRMKNSWGRSWGVNGHALIGFKDLDRLLREDGEACLARELKG